MNLDDLLRDTLSDDRWALAPSPETLPAVRRRRVRRQATRAAGTVLVVGGLVAGGVLLAGSLPGGDDRATVTPADAPTGTGLTGSCSAAPPATPIPGSTPAYVVDEVHDWIQTAPESKAFYTGFQNPSPGPTYYAASPAPVGPLSERLRSELIAGGVPENSRFTLDEVSDGRRDNPSVTVALPDGRTFYVGREPLTAPLNRGGIGGDENYDAAPVDVPGTGCTAIVYSNPDVQAVGSVTVISPDGWSTLWISDKVPAADLRAWAFAATRWAATHPG